MASRSVKLILLAALCAAVTLFGVPAIAQPQNFQAGLHFSAALPQGDFEDAIDDNAYGISGDLLWSPARTPFGIGISLAFHNFSSDTRREPFSHTIPDVTVDVTTTNNMFQGYLLARTQLKRGDLRPYADGLFGFNYFFMETKIQDVDSDEEVVSSTDHDDAALSYGVGGGLLVRVYSGVSEGDRTTVLLDLGVRYLIGGDAEYVTRKDIVDGEVTYSIVTTPTDMLMLRAGLTISF